MKIREYCKCGSSLIGTISERAGGGLKTEFWNIHTGPEHGPTTPAKCRAKRFREENKTVNADEKALRKEEAREK